MGKYLASYPGRVEPEARANSRRQRSGMILTAIITRRLSTFLAIVILTVARVHTMVSLQVPDTAQSSSWGVSLSPSWDVSSDGLTGVVV